MRKDESIHNPCYVEHLQQNNAQPLKKVCTADLRLLFVMASNSSVEPFWQLVMYDSVLSRVARPFFIGGKPVCHAVITKLAKIFT